MPLPWNLEIFRKVHCISIVPAPNHARNLVVRWQKSVTEWRGKSPLGSKRAQWQLKKKKEEEEEELECIGHLLCAEHFSADGDCSHEIKRILLLGRKAMTNLDSILKNGDITLPTNVCLVKAMVFPVVHVWMGELDYKESWAPKNWCFWTVVLEKTLESPLNCKEIQLVHPQGNQSWIFIGRTDAETETPMRRIDSLEKTLMLGKIEGGRRRGWQRMRWLDDTTDLMDISVSKLQDWLWTGKQGVLQSVGLQSVGHNWPTELNWTMSTVVHAFHMFTRFRSQQHDE